ncbi:hypothetical protein A3Q56_05313 [Intoshia linei]|uniref:Uncharacterized protein n=1 Tax=Intoshia linei TaxID=1819745 RepID=A0A177AYA8_9BILA|nr:hypothetical protein A3Q56_05313 [Intoshia linei]
MNLDKHLKNDDYLCGKSYISDTRTRENGQFDDKNLSSEVYARINYSFEKGLSYDDAVDASQIKKATIILNSHLKEHGNLPDMYNKLRENDVRPFSVSGRKPTDYFEETIVNPESTNFMHNEIKSIDSYPIPAFVYRHKQYSEVNSANSLMGLCHDIKRAWLILKNIIYMWNYENGSDLSYFEGIQDQIVDAVLIKPDKNIMSGEYLYLFVITTIQDLIVLGVVNLNKVDSIDGIKPGLQSKPLYVKALESTVFLKSHVTQDKRLFLADNAGNLQELVYQNQSNWFFSKFSIINHSSSIILKLIPKYFINSDVIIQITSDYTRNFLYTLHQSGTICVYLLKENSSISKISSLDLSTIKCLVGKHIVDLDRTKISTLIHISPILATESCVLTLVAVSNSGFRLYFTIYDIIEGIPRDNVSQLSLIHLRFPPGYNIENSEQRPTTIKKAFYSAGTLVMISSVSENNDIVWVVSSNYSNINSKSFTETTDVMKFNGGILSISDRIISISTPESFLMNSKNSNFKRPPTNLTNHLILKNLIFIQTSEGTFVLTKMSQTSRLETILSQKTPNVSNLTTYFNQKQNANACVDCIQLICCHLNGTDMMKKQNAFETFRSFGGLCKQLIQQELVNFNDPIAYISEMNGSDESAIAKHFSLIPRLYGIYEYFSRIVSPVWKYNLCNIKLCSNSDNSNFKFTLTYDFMTESIRVLVALYSCTEDLLPHVTLELSSKANGVGMEHVDNIEKQILFIERDLYIGLLQLIKINIELLKVFLLLHEHQLHNFVSNLSAVSFKNFTNLTFENIITTFEGRQCISELLNLLIGKYIQDCAMLDIINSRLRSQCPTFYSSTDADIAKAAELLQPINETNYGYNPQDNYNRILAAVDIYKKNVRHINLYDSCCKLARSNAFCMIIDICLLKAKIVDPNSPTNLSDSRKRLNLSQHQDFIPEIISYRMDCYKPIFIFLDYLLYFGQSHPSQNNFIMPKDYSRKDADKEFENMYVIALKSSDPIFHTQLYDWLFSRELITKLRQINTEYFEEYLYNIIEKDQDNVECLDIFWRFMVRNKRYLYASKILHKMAMRCSDSLKLQERIEILSRALLNSKLAFKNDESITLIKVLEDKIEVTKIQQEALQILQTTDKSLQDDDLAYDIYLLNHNILDINMLYRDIAEKRNMYTVKLNILYCANVCEMELIELIWSDIINEVFDNFYKLTHESIESKPDRSAIISQKFVNIIKVYKNRRSHLPLPIVFNLIANRANQFNFNKYFVVDCFLLAGISFVDVILALDKVIQENMEYWQKHADPYYLHDMFLKVVLRFLDLDYTKLEKHDSMEVQTTLSEIISNYLRHFKTDPITPDNKLISSMTNKFTQIQDLFS